MREPSLDVITGPMFSGKSTELLRRLNICSALGFTTLYINCNLDTRDDEDFSTHNPTIKSIGKLTSVKLDNELTIDSVRDSIDINEFNVIGIDEAQMFTGLKDTVLTLVETYHKKVIVAGLNGDFRRQKWGEIIDLIPYCEDITKLNSVCSFCSRIKNTLVDAPFTKRLTSSKETLLVGDNDNYAAVCRNCYFIKK
jgi:thymidine kinase